MFFSVSGWFFVEQLARSQSACVLRACRRRRAGLQDFSTASIFARLASDGGVIGRRHTGSSKPIIAIAAFTGIGIGLDEIHFHQRQPVALQARARPRNRPPARAASACVISAGISFETTKSRRARPARSAES